jgi:hypothetical protein
VALSNYTELLAAIASYLARDDLTATIPDFVKLAEAKFNRTLFHPRMETRTTLTVDTLLADPEFLDLPSDFQTMRSVRLSGVAGKPRLNFLTQTQIEDYRYSIDNVSDQPVYFSIVGDQMELAPTPNEDFDVEILYRANIPALASSSTNWLLTLAPDLYLYGSLLEAMPYNQNDARIALWGSAVATVLDQLNALAERQSFDSGPTTISLPGVTP